VSHFAPKLTTQAQKELGRHKKNNPTAFAVELFYVIGYLNY
jgi:hypothetical protein